MLGALGVLLLAVAGEAAGAGVVINEIQYHPPDDRDDLQWVELLNTGAEAVDLRGWSLAKGCRFSFTNEYRLAAGELVVIARDRGAFVTQYGSEAAVLGDFAGRLSHSGEAIELRAADGRLVDTVRYQDEEPWPRSADGMGASLERIVATVSGDAAENWAPSPLPALAVAGGTPGRPNAAARDDLPPVLEGVTWKAPAVGEPMDVTLQARDAEGVRHVFLMFQSLGMEHTHGASSAGGATWQEQPMERVSGDAGQGTYRATIPGQPEGRLVRFRVVAEDGRGGRRELPHPHDARPSWTAYVGPNRNEGQIPWISLMEFGPPEQPGESLRTPRRRGRGGNPGVAGEPARGEAAVVWMPPKGRPVEVRDHVRITPRHGGWKVRLQKDRLLEEMSTVNLLFEFRPRYVLAEHLSFELYRAAGVPAPLSGHWRVWHNGQPLGYHLYVEQLNASFLRRVGRDPDGDLFKLLWYGNGVVGQHEKKNNPESGHAELVALIEELRRQRGPSGWDWMQRHFEVEEVAGYFAVNMCLQNWDGFFNNYFVYCAPGKGGKWEILPWDEDKTWGDYDGASSRYDWYTMPLTLGMAGDRPSGGGLRFLGSGPFGGGAWWRPPGWFSGPLLAHPQFRERFRGRLRDLCETVFTPAVQEVGIRRLEVRLEPEVAYRAWIQGPGRDPARRAGFPPQFPAWPLPTEGGVGEMAEFHEHLRSFRNQVQHRREFLLKELAREE